MRGLVKRGYLNDALYSAPALVARQAARRPSLCGLHLRRRKAPVSPFPPPPRRRGGSGVQQLEDVVQPSWANDDIVCEGVPLKLRLDSFSGGGLRRRTSSCIKMRRLI